MKNDTSATVSKIMRSGLVNSLRKATIGLIRRLGTSTFSPCILRSSLASRDESPGNDSVSEERDSRFIPRRKKKKMLPV
jgi:hypothetical protein